MYWSTLLWSREAIFFIPGFWCCCLYLLFVGVFFLFFIYDLNQERNDYHPWVNWTSDRRAIAVAPSVCLSVLTVSRCFFFVGYVKRGWPQKKLSNSAPKSSYPWANFSKQLPCFLCAFPLNTLAAPIVLRTALDFIIIVPWGNVAKLSRYFFLSSRKINFRILSNSPGCPHLLYNYSVARSLGKSCQHSRDDSVRSSELIKPQIIPTSFIDSVLHCLRHMAESIKTTTSASLGCAVTYELENCRCWQTTLIIKTKQGSSNEVGYIWKTIEVQ